MSPALATSSSRKNGLPPVRRWRASTVRNDGSSPNTAARNPLTSAGASRLRRTLVTAWRRSSRVQEIAGGVTPRQSVGTVGADDQERTAIGLGEALEQRQALRVGPVEVLEHDETRVAGGEQTHEVDACPHPVLGRLADVGHDRGQLGMSVQVGHCGASRGTAPSAARRSPGRPDRQGPRCAGSTLSISSRASRVLPMPASPAISATAGEREAPTRDCSRLNSAVRPTITGERPVRATSMLRAYVARQRAIECDQLADACFAIARSQYRCGQIVHAGHGQVGGGLGLSPLCSTAENGQAMLARVLQQPVLAVAGQSPREVIVREHDVIVRPYAGRPHRARHVSSRGFDA